MLFIRNTGCQGINHVILILNKKIFDKIYDFLKNESSFHTT
jgi:hypothetical protein